MTLPVQTPSDALFMTWVLFALATVFQGIEEWMLAGREHSAWIPAQADAVRFFGPLPVPGLRFSSGVRILSALFGCVQPFHPILILVLVLATWLRSLRFLGSVNGGSDTMTHVVLFPLLVVSLFPGNEAVQKGALFWIAIQSALSYFLSGVRKARNPQWWSGDALVHFFGASRVAFPLVRNSLIRSSGWARAMAPIVVIFELVFPCGLFFPGITPWFLGAGCLFHLMVFLIFGLNRFFWIWLATYPAILYLAQSATPWTLI